MAVKVDDAAPTATVTEAGVVSRGLLLDKEIVATLTAALFKVTVQVLVAPEERLPPVQVSEERAAGATRLRVVDCETPFKVAVSVAD